MAATRKLSAQPQTENTQFATFAAGCFWGVEKFFQKEFGQGIHETAVGYTGGSTVSPSYEQVCTGKTGHAEAFRLAFRPSEVSYENLVRYFFRIHDPTTPNRQGNDVGTQYRSSIFYHSDEQRAIAERVKMEVQKEFYPQQAVCTEIVPARDFWEAEAYHQRYLENNPGGYCNHRLRW